MGFSLGVDIGGTFTDLVVADGTGLPALYKVSSTPDDPSRGVEAGIDLIAHARGLARETCLAACDLVIHGTTIATNALLQLAGSRTALICTEGFRDSLEIRLGYKERRYDFGYPPPPVLVPRHLRLGVPERTTKEGAVRVPLDEGALKAHAEYMRSQSVEAVAICFLWSFLNPGHERRAGELLGEWLPQAYISLSSEVLPEIREYDRVSTTVLNAYLGPICMTYFRTISDLLQARGFAGEVRYIQGNAGLASAEFLSRKPVFSINSGPAAAPAAGVFYCKALGLKDMITMDMGGTSFDVCLVENGSPAVVKHRDVFRYRLGIPIVDLTALGVGGGSVAWLESGEILRVGPRSAGARPGPACYGRGGVEPTVTDANVVLGYFGDDSTLADGVRIDRAAAERAIDEHVGVPSSLTTVEASHAIYEVVTDLLMRGLRSISVERGVDPRDFALVSGGGAGGVHCARLAQELGIGLVVIPRLAAGLCALGELVSDLRHHYGRSYPRALADVDDDRLLGLFAEMEREARRDLASEGAREDAVELERWVELRYVGQLAETRVEFALTPSGRPDLAACLERFHARNEALYAHSDRSEGSCELFGAGMTAWAPPPAGQPVLRERPAVTDWVVGRRRPAYFAQHGGYVDTPIVSAEDVPCGVPLAGPAIVEERTTTIVVVPGTTIVLDEGGFYRLTVDGGAPPR